MSWLRKLLGQGGESVAVRHLKRQGYRILNRNYACPAGELDVVCRKDGTIVFVEVKSLRSDLRGDPEQNVTRAKQRHLLRAARHWLADHDQPQAAYRFDVVSVVLPESGPPRVRHIVEAFVPDAE